MAPRGRPPKKLTKAEQTAKAKAENVKQTALSTFKQRRFTKDDFVALCVFSTYMVQKMGEVSIQDLLITMKKAHGATVHKNTLAKVLEALRKKGHLVANYGVEGERVYSMADLKFNCRVEVAHVDEIIPILLNDPLGRAIKAEIEGDRSAGTTKAVFPCEMADFTVQFQLDTPWHGSQSLDANPYLTEMYEQSKFNNTFDKNCDPKDIPLVFERLGTESIVIHNGCVMGLVTDHCSKMGIAESAIKKWCSFKGIVHIPKKIKVCRYPIIRWENGKMQGAGFGYYETIYPGEVITWEFSGPTKNFMTIPQWEFFIRHILDKPNRMMSPARGSQTGNATLLSFVCELWKDKYPDVFGPDTDKNVDEAA